MARDFFPAFLSVASTHLAPLGFMPLLRGTFKKPLVPGVDAWLGINHAFYSEGDGSLRLVLLSGVRHEFVERRLADIAPREDRPGHATVVKNIEQLRPVAQRGDIYVDGPRFIEPAAITVAERVRDYGLPFAASLVDLSRLADALSESRDMSAFYRAPIARLVLGDLRGARASLAEALARFPPNTGGPIDQAFRAYADDLLAILDAMER